MNMNALKIQMNTSTQTIHTIARGLEFSGGSKLTVQDALTRDQILEFIASSKKQLPNTPVGNAHRNTLNKIAAELKKMEVR